MPNLVGIGLSQVPTNSMLGGLAYQDPEHASIKDLDLKNLSQINSEIADSAVDIFVYDTSKDSDGGAWRKRTQHTSWYNETLGTATRGTRREFPAVAVIVAQETTNQQVVIYDGDDPDLPMWMVFERGGNNDPFLDGSTPGASFLGNYPPTSVSAFNGIICAGCWRSAGSLSNLNAGLRRFSFIEDNCIAFNNSNSYKIGDVIANRNVITMSQYALGNPIVNVNVHDVAMTVLPNSQVDEITGLPVPTIAVATAGGVSVIKDDGSVVDITANAGSNYHNSDFISIANDGFLVFPQHGTGATGEYSLMTIPIPDSDRTTQTSSGNVSDKYIFNDPNSALVSLPHGLGFTQNGAIRIPGTQFLNYPNGLAILSEKPSSLGDAMVNYITKDYNTGWMHGDIKGAFLSDTDATNVTGEKIDLTNGSVPAGNNASVASITANQLVFQSSSETVGRYDTGTTLVTGKQYHATLTISNYSGSGDLGVASGGGIDATFRYSANGTYTRYITGNDGNEIQLFYRNSNSATIGLTIKEVNPDRSHYNEGLAVYGTITKSAVATGADLVAYSGWSTSNYLEQPINTDMNVGTGDFYVMGWIYPTSNSTGYVWEYAAPSNNSGYTEMFYHDSGVLRFYIEGGTPAEKSVSLNVWQHFVCVRRSGQIYLYVNGVSSSAVSDTAAIDNTSAKLRIGIRAYAVASPFYGKIALVRMGASAPSPEQIKKIYEDEKVLFQENAKATLYGSSDTVTALAYDEVTERLHVGTSAGRSDFQGLRRINNTTTAVTTAISAHDGFTVEQ